jgi:hypothetical protein
MEQSRLGLQITVLMSFKRLPAPILAAAAVILRVTKRLGRSGDS